MIELGNYQCLLVPARVAMMPLIYLLPEDMTSFKSCLRHPDFPSQPNFNFFRVCWLFLLFSLGLLEPYTHGTFWTAAVVIYTVTSAVAGYTAASFHSQFSEAGWVNIVFFSATDLFAPLYPSQRSLLIL